MKRALLVLLLSGCATSDTCIQRGWFTGDKIKNLETGKIGVVEKIYGESYRCPVDSHPILADVNYN